MSTKPNLRRGHDRIQDGGPHGAERKRWAVGRSRRKRLDAKRARTRERNATPTDGPFVRHKKPFRISGRTRWKTNG